MERIEIEASNELNIVTVQGLTRAIINPSERNSSAGICRYVCIIVDEAPPEYTLDCEVSEVGLSYCERSDYANKYLPTIVYCERDPSLTLYFNEQEAA